MKVKHYLGELFEIDPERSEGGRALSHAFKFDELFRRPQR